tara:strand:+ start:517 stop:924 length:408 start_codon:yes stop_codon:yes gene_type:complete
MKLLLENWRKYLNEGTGTTAHILDALEKFKDYDMDEQLFALLDALLGIENPQYEDLKAVFDVLVSEDRTKEGYMLIKYMTSRNSNKDTIQKLAIRDILYDYSDEVEEKYNKSIGTPEEEDWREKKKAVFNTIEEM